MPVPARPTIYHIVHVDNLASIVADKWLWPDAVMVQRQGAAVIANKEIKTDRLRLPVSCHPGTCVGDYVPFYFRPRSVMLYVIYRGNHPNVAYRDGQGPVVHLLADVGRSSNGPPKLREDGHSLTSMPPTARPISTTTWVISIN
jgi:hypothetical protein